MNKKILDKISKLDKDNEKLFIKKVELEKEIAIIDVKIWKIHEEHQKIIKELYEIPH